MTIATIGTVYAAQNHNRRYFIFDDHSLWRRGSNAAARAASNNEVIAWPGSHHVKREDRTQCNPRSAALSRFAAISVPSSVQWPSDKR
jgi:hypothetical protein